MVSTRRLLLLLLLCLPGLNTIALADDALWLELGGSEQGEAHTRQGHYLRADLYLDSDGLSLEAVDLAPWKPLFHVEKRQGNARTADPRGGEKTVQRLRLRLYPRRSGKLVLPPLSLGTLQTAARQVQIEAAQLGGRTIGFETRLAPNAPPSRPWEREQVRFSIHLKNADPRAHFEAPQAWKPHGFETLRLEDSRAPDGSPVLNWALYPLLGGELELEPPLLTLRQGGGASQRYYLPLESLQVRPLPPYLPPTLPVGKVTLQESIEADGRLETGRLAQWQVTLQSPSLPAHWLPSLRQLLSAASGVRIHPVKQEKTTRLAPDEPRGTVLYRIPFTPLTTGTLVLPPLHVDYFDPATGTLQRATLSGENRHRPYVVKPWWLPAIIAIALLALGWLGFHGGRRLSRYLKSRRRQLALIDAMRHAHSPCELIRLTLQLDGRHPPAETLQQWLDGQPKIKDASPLHTLATELSTACYGPEGSASTDFPTLRERWIEQVTKPGR